MAFDPNNGKRTQRRKGQSGNAAHLRVSILRTICRQRIWTVTGVFADEDHESGLYYHEFLEHARSLNFDAVLAWAWRSDHALMPPQLEPNIFLLPRNLWHQYLRWSGVTDQPCLVASSISTHAVAGV